MPVGEAEGVLCLGRDGAADVVYRAISPPEMGPTANERGQAAHRRPSAYGAFVYSLLRRMGGATKIRHIATYNSRLIRLAIRSIQGVSGIFHGLRHLGQSNDYILDNGESEPCIFVANRSTNERKT